MEDEKQKAPVITKGILEWYDAFIVTFVAVLIVFVCIFRVATVQQNSMYPTLHENDRVLVQKMFANIEKGDIVVVDGQTDYGKALVKRVIGESGDTIDIDVETGFVYVNGVQLNEPYVNELTYTRGDTIFPITVPEGKLFLMGDNRNNSMDSRHQSIGYVDEQEILGELIVRIYPFDRIGSI